jgi:hypothetical protein
MAVTVFLRQAKPNGLPVTMTFKQANHASHGAGAVTLWTEGTQSEAPVAVFNLDCIVGWEIKPEDAKAE